MFPLHQKERSQERAWPTRLENFTVIPVLAINQKCHLIITNNMHLMYRPVLITSIHSFINKTIGLQFEGNE